MPIYEYRCEECGKEFEEIVFGDDPVPCPSCNSANTNKLMSCCRFKSEGGGSTSTSSSGSSSSCAGCSGGNCATCG
ncbi:MAG: zinc ribbon domain-containing protein [Desulfovibrio sp.]|nr:MAG: zinc ribbon domain-containing protein [Desulfovibrio sp.]